MFQNKKMYQNGIKKKTSDRSRIKKQLISFITNREQSVAKWWSNFRSCYCKKYQHSVSDSVSYAILAVYFLIQMLCATSYSYMLWCSTKISEHIKKYGFTFYHNSSPFYFVCLHVKIIKSTLIDTCLQKVDFHFYWRVSSLQALLPLLRQTLSVQRA